MRINYIACSIAFFALLSEVKAPKNVRQTPEDTTDGTDEDDDTDDDDDIDDDEDNVAVPGAEMHANKVDDLKRGWFFTDIFIEDQKLGHGKFLLRMAKVQKKRWVNTFSECTEEYEGLESKTYKRTEVKKVLKGMHFKLCRAPAPNWNLKKAYALKGDIEFEFNEDKRFMKIRCHYSQTGTNRVITVSRKSMKRGVAYLYPAMWRRLKGSEGRVAAHEERECHLLLHNFIDMQNRMVREYMAKYSDAENKDVTKLLMPEIESSEDINKQDDTPSLGAGYIVLIIVSVLLVVGLTWFGLSKMSKQKSIEEEEKLIKKHRKERKKERMNNEHDFERNIA